MLRDVVEVYAQGAKGGSHEPMRKTVSRFFFFFPGGFWWWLLFGFGFSLNWVGIRGGLANVMQNVLDFEAFKMKILL